MLSEEEVATGNNCLFNDFLEIPVRIVQLEVSHKILQRYGLNSKS